MRTPNQSIPGTDSYRKVKLPRNKKLKIGPSAVAAFKNRIKIAADSINGIRADYSGIGRLMETSMMHGGFHEQIAFREWLLRQRELSVDARQALLDF